MTAAGEGWCRIITAVLIARRSYVARTSWIRLLMPERAGPSRRTRRLDQLGLRSRPAMVWHPVHLSLGHAAAAVRAPKPADRGAACPGGGSREDVSARSAGPSARYTRKRERSEDRVWQRASHMRAMASKRPADLDVRLPGRPRMQGKFGGEEK